MNRMDLTGIISALHLELEQIDAAIQSLEHLSDSPNARRNLGDGKPILMRTPAPTPRTRRSTAMDADAFGNDLGGNFSADLPTK